MNASPALKNALEALTAERAQIDQAIAQLQAMLRLPARKNGSGASRRKPRWSPAMRKAAKERMQKYWAARRKSAKK